MLSAKLLVGEIVSSLRQVIGPTISEPYPKAQAYVAATILEFVARRIEERGASDSEREAVLESLFDDIGELGLPARIASVDSRDEADYLKTRLPGAETFYANWRQGGRQMRQGFCVRKDPGCGLLRNFSSLHEQFPVTAWAPATTNTKRFSISLLSEAYGHRCSGGRATGVQA